MRGMLQPVGPLPPSVYWRRRAVAAAALVLVLGLLVWAISAAATSDDEADASVATPAAAGQAAPPPSPVASRGSLPGVATHTCTDGELRIAARTDKSRYTRAERPLLSLVITNAGPAPCSRDLDTARMAMAVVVTPGEGLWSSSDCPPPRTNDVRTFQPGQEAVIPLRWDGRRSQPGCTGGRGAVPGGDYQLLTRLDGLISEPARFTIES